MNEEMYSMLAKYFSGQATEQERNTVEEWAAHSEENRNEFIAARALWEKAGEPEAPEFDTEAAWQKLRAVIDQPPVQKKGRIWPIGFKAAAAAILLLVAGLWWITRSNGNKTITADVAMKEILLDDGSHVYLRKNASLSFPRHFKKDKRTVELNGEAFFEVAKNPDKPFIITASGTTVKVLGTSFTVNTGNGQVEVVVKTGKVQFSSVKNSAQNAVLLPGEKAVIKNDELLKEKNTDENFDSWQTGMIMFRNTPMKEVIRVLGRHYQAAITCRKGDEDKVLATLVTSTFTNQSLENVIKELELITSFRIQKTTGEAYEISSQ